MSRHLQGTTRTLKLKRRQGSVSNRTIILFLSVSSMLLLVLLNTFTSNPSDKWIRGAVVEEKQNVVEVEEKQKDMEAAFAKIREKVEKEKIDYSEDWSIDDMWKRLKCNKIFKKERPIHSYTDWLFARSLYRDIVGRSQSSIGSSDGDVKNGRLKQNKLLRKAEAYLH